MQRHHVATALALGLALVPVAAPAGDDLYAYPEKGQTAEQLERDKEACHTWAVQQTGVDPTTLGDTTPPTTASGGRSGLLGGAGVGAARGAASGDAAAGAVHGLGIAALVRVVRKRREMNEQHQSYMEAHEKQETQLAQYDRAYGACLTGRGYSVR